jgi:PEP-CTERM motif
MLSIHRLLPAVVLAATSTASMASTDIYTSLSAFQALLAPGSYTETFDGLANPPAGPVGFSGGGFAYTASAPNDIYLEGDFLGASQIDEALTINFLGGNVRAVGADFFATDINDTPIPTLVTITLSDGTVEAFTPTSFAETYRGFVSTLAITSLVISGPGQSLYAGLDNLTVGAVPEPTSWALMGLGLAGIIVVARRRTV